MATRKSPAKKSAKTSSAKGPDAKKTRKKSSSGNYTKPELREKIKKKVVAGSKGGRPGQWSARKAQLVTNEYKGKGGGFKHARNKAQKSLKSWGDEKWNTSDGKKATREKTTRRYLPDKAWKELAPSDRKATDRKKASAARRGKQFVKTHPLPQKLANAPQSTELDRCSVHHYSRSPGLAAFSSRKSCYISAMELTFDPQHSAVLALDCQSGVVSVYAKPANEFIARASEVLKAARVAGMTVIQVQVGFRPGLPEVSDRNKLLGAIRASKPHQEFFQGASGAIHPALGPEPDDVVIIKHRISAFAGTDLEMILRARDIHTLVIFGIATSGVVLSTLLQACDSDYRLFVIGDCCTDLDLELHASLVKRLFPSLANIVSAEEFVSAVQEPS